MCTCFICPIFKHKSNIPKGCSLLAGCIDPDESIDSRSRISLCSSPISSICRRLIVDRFDNIVVGNGDNEGKDDDDDPL